MPSVRHYMPRYRSCDVQQLTPGACWCPQPCVGRVALHNSRRRGPEGHFQGAHHHAHGDPEEGAGPEAGVGQPQRCHAPWLERDHHQVGKLCARVTARASRRHRSPRAAAPVCSRDTIHIDGLELGFKKPVLFERHAVGGEYGAGFDVVGRGTLTTVFKPEVRSLSRLGCPTRCAPRAAPSVH